MKQGDYASAGGHGTELSVIDLYIQKQQSLSAVELFSQWHAQAPAFPEPLYRDLIPLTSPQTGQQYAFEVDLDECTGCKACVTACHNLNGLDFEETWRAVGLVTGTQAERFILQTVTTACHHCLDPECLLGCPVKAYEKDSVTGIVRHLDDQCIGCQYCVLKCPYGVPQYNEPRGIVRKCDMCTQRLEVKEAPACVQGCPNGAIKITIVDQAEVRETPEAFVQVAGAPDSRFTFPTTKYKTQKIYPAQMSPAHQYTLTPEQAHWPLVWMLVLTQASVGGFLTLAGIPHEAGSQAQGLASLILGLVALAASVTHLGRPLYAFRAILGLKTSWLSREILVFGGFAKLALLWAFWPWIQKIEGLPLWFQSEAIARGLYVGVIASGLLGVWCSAMIYKTTPRLFWRSWQTPAKFLLTTLLLGTGLAWCFALMMPQQAEGELVTTLCLALMLWAGLKLGVETLIWPHAKVSELTALKKTALLFKTHFRRLTWMRWGALGLGGVLLPSIGWAGTTTLPGEGLSALAVLSLGLCFVGEVIERYLFFRVAVPPRMPGL